MSNKDKLISYVSKPLKSTQLKYIYKVNNIQNETANIFYDFSLLLTNLILTTYLGDDVVNEENYETHFKWCFNKSINIFNGFNISFKSDGQHYYYYFNHFKSHFYLKENKDTDEVFSKNMKYWDVFFNMSGIKTKAMVDSFCFLYNILNKNLIN